MTEFILRYSLGQGFAFTAKSVRICKFDQRNLLSPRADLLLSCEIFAGFVLHDGCLSGKIEGRSIAEVI